MTDTSELKRLKALYSYEILDTGPEPEYDDLARLAAAICKTPIAIVTLIDERRQWFKSHIGLDIRETDRAIAFCNFTIQGEVPFIVEDALEDDRFRDNPLVAGELGIRFYAGIPLIDREGERLGSLAVIDKVPRKLEPHQLDHLVVLARQVIMLFQLRMERNLHRETTNRLANAQNMGRMGTWEHYIGSDHLSWSHEVHEIFGTTPETFGSNLKAFHDLVHPDDLQAVINAAPAVIAGEKDLDITHRIIRPDGGVRHVRERARLFKPTGSGVGLIVGTVQDITDEVLAMEREQAIQRELRHAHDILNFHIENTPLGVVEWNHEFRVIRWSKRARAIFGWEEGEVFGFHPNDWEFVHPDDGTSVDRVMSELLTLAVPRNTILNRNFTRDGKVIHCEWYNSVLRDEDGKLVSIFSLVHDVSERVNLEEQYRQGQALARIGGELGRLGGWELDATTRQIRWSEEIFKLLEWDADDPPSLEECLQMYPVEYRPTIEEAVNRCIGEGTAFDLELELFTAKGRRIHARALGGAERDPSGRIIRVLGAFQDITERKRTEEEYQSLSRRLKLTLDNMSDGFYLLDHDWNYVYINAQAERILGLDFKELAGKSVWEKFPDLKGSEVQDYFLKAIETGRHQQYSMFYPPMEEWYQVDVYPSSEGIAVYFRTISERMKLEEQLRQSQRLETVGQLTGGVAHDFNNLLTVVLGNAELLQDELEANRHLGGLAKMIVSAATRGAELTHRLLAFARKQALEPKRVDVNTLIRGMDALLGPTLGEQVEVDFLPGENIWPAFVDASQLESTLLNLAVNARDAMPSGGHLTIETANVVLDESYTSRYDDVVPGDYVVLSVSDTGIGIPGDQIGRVFEPFYTTKAEGRGTGLGLSMVYGFVKQSHGHVKIYSEVGVGTTIKVYLPRDAGTPPEERPVAANQSVDVGTGETILVVEDDDLVRTYAGSQLSALGYNVIAAENAHKGLDILTKRDDIDLLFTDIVMPGGMNGRQLAEKAQEMKPGLKVLYTSGYTDNAMIHHGRLDPGTFLLGKPYTRVELAGKVRRVLNGQEP
ncbi:MAG: PAS domain S-box protein [Candidatus Sumerlaeia bacterium]|nr:PAS domain S-box protein [Candidatus Sumerlaeia bacterium]